MSFTPFRLQMEDASSTVLLTGDVDEPAAVELRDALEKHSAGFERSLTVDLTAVTFLPSFAIGVLVSAMRRAKVAGHEVELVAQRASIAQRVLEICVVPHRTTDA